MEGWLSYCIITGRYGHFVLCSNKLKLRQYLLTASNANDMMAHTRISKETEPDSRGTKNKLNKMKRDSFFSGR